MDKEYLGDGVYIEIVHGSIRIWTERMDRAEPTVDEIFFDGTVLKAFISYLKRHELLA